MARAFVWLGIVWSVSCAGKDWRRAQEANTGEAYRSFATANPDSSRVSLALYRAEQLDWIAARATDTSAAYAAYVGAHPGGPHAAEARQRAEALSLAAARSEGTPEALTAFLAQFPASTHQAEIEEQLERLWHDRAVEEGTEEAWGRYLVRYPSGRWAGDARTARDEAAWARALRDDTRAGYEQYVSRFSSGLHRLDALDWLDRVKVGRLQPVVSLGTAPGTPEQRRALTYAVRKTVDATLVADLKRDFEIARTIMVDLQGGEPPHPQDTYRYDADTGLLVIVYNEAPGAALDPSGFATDIEAAVQLYCPPSRKPVVDTTVTASTPLPVQGTDEAVLHDSAVEAFGDQLLFVADEVATVRKEAR